MTYIPNYFNSSLFLICYHQEAAQHIMNSNKAPPPAYDPPAEAPSDAAPASEAPVATDPQPSSETPAQSTEPTKAQVKEQHKYEKTLNKDGKHEEKQLKVGAVTWVGSLSRH